MTLDLKTLDVVHAAALQDVRSVLVHGWGRHDRRRLQQILHNPSAGGSSRIWRRRRNDGRGDGLRGTSTSSGESLVAVVCEKHFHRGLGEPLSPA